MRDSVESTGPSPAPGRAAEHSMKLLVLSTLAALLLSGRFALAAVILGTVVLSAVLLLGSIVLFGEPGDDDV